MNNPSQSGSAHIVAIVCLVLALLTAIGWIFYQNFVANESTETETELLVVEKDKAEASDNDKKTDAMSYETPSEAVLINAYKESNPGVGSDFIVSGINAKRSETVGYMIVYAGAGNTNAVTGGGPVSFYRTPDKKWHYTEEFQQTLSCPSKNSSDVRKAYLGEPCYDKAGKQTVVR